MAASGKQQVKELVEQKDALEKEIEGLMTYLNGPGMPGLKGGLVDDQGFPIDNVALILSVRQARNKLACTYLE